MNPLTELSLDDLRARHSVKWTTHPPDVLPMFIAEMDTPLSPAVAATLRGAVDRGDTGYASMGRLAEAYAAFACARFGWRPDATAMRLIPDVNTGIYESVLALTERGDGVVIDTPAYPPFFSKLRHAERVVIENPMLEPNDRTTGFDVDLDGLERAFAGGAKAYLMCNPHNPTGTVLSRATLLAIAALAEHYDVQVLADEVHGPLTYPGGAHVPFQTLAALAAQRSVAFVSASKAWNLPGLKAALAIPGPAEPDLLAAMPAEVSFAAGLLGTLAAEAALTGDIDWLDALIHGLDHNRRRLAELLAADVPEVRFRPPDATYLGWLDCRALGLGDDPAAAFLDVGRLAVNAGPTFGTAGNGFARINFACHPDLIVEAVGRIAATVAGRR